MTRPRIRRAIAGSLVASIAVIAGFLLSPWGDRFLQDPRNQDAVVGASTIVLADNWFDPPVSQVTTGTTVTFVWDDNGAVHDVAFDDGPSSAVIGEGTYTRTFTEPGTYDYTCTLHPFMDGRIVVTAP
ncbi:MAG: cupredoxin domain-containing protein [Nitriliruptoraceae bacterium]|nr:cupredoxin domain-containing protein [Nitriliruptoraceae bacterium]